MNYQLDLQRLKSELRYNLSAIRKKTIQELGHGGGVLLKLIFFKQDSFWYPYVVTELGTHRLLCDDGFTLCLLTEDVTVEGVKECCGWERDFEQNLCAPNI